MQTDTPTKPGIMTSIKARQKAVWESGDFGEVARYTMPMAEEFMARLDLKPGVEVLDAACGTGNLAVIAARQDCQVSGLDIASNLIAQARERAATGGLRIDYAEGDVEEMPYPAGSFDAVVSMFGVMFAPQPHKAVKELLRVTRPGGVIALACWTPEGFIGKMFDIFRRHVPPAPVAFPSPLLWGDEKTVRERLFEGIGLLRLTRRVTHFRHPFSPARTVEFFRTYYGPTMKAFESISPEAGEALRRDLVRHQEEHNIAGDPNETVTPSEYLEIVAQRL